MSMPPLKNAPSSMLMRAAATSPVSAPSARMSTRSVAETLPFSLPRTTISRALMLAFTWPFLPTVTRLPGMLMLPSTLPSMNSDSVPVISPLMERPLLMLACSPTVAAGRAGSSVGCTGIGRGGSGVGEFGLVGPCWVGFHIALKMVPFLSWWDWGCQGRGHFSGPKYLRFRDCVRFHCGAIACARNMMLFLLGVSKHGLLPLL